MEKSLKAALAVLFALALTGTFAWSPGHSVAGMTAAEVKDKESLKGFVRTAIAHLKTGYDQAVKDFRIQGQWRKGSIYLFGLDKKGVLVFHVAKPELEGRSINLVDEDGPRNTEELVKMALEGDGFIEYKFDDPATTDTDEAVLKISYAEAFQKGDRQVVIGAGFYPRGK